MEILKVDNISFSYGNNKVFDNFSCSFDTGKINAIVGRSGAGKTTLLSLLSGLTDPQEGKILLDGRDLKEMDKYEYRSRNIGIIFQSFNLLTNLTAVENVELSMDISGIKDANRTEQAYRVLERVGMTRDECDRRVLKLSGGQQQRVAIARAISYNPDIIIADEPTGNLDEETQQEIIDILKEFANEGKCIIVVTHSRFVAEQADKVIRITRKK